jgi:hypothetical protein
VRVDHLSGGGAVPRALRASIGEPFRGYVPPRKSASGKKSERPGIALLRIQCASCGTWSVLELPGASP